MLVLLIAAALSAPAHKAAVKSHAPEPPPADVWLDCSWHETWKTSGSLGSASSSNTSEHDYAKSYMFSPKNSTFFLYQPDQTLFRENAVIGATAILVETQDHYESLGYLSKSQRQWTVSRQDLKVQLLGSSETDSRMDDGRIATTAILETGEGTCAIADPKPLATPAPNKF